ncbi:uncharacterized protein PG998_009363 [Apiospora kogelbergensis]|uniref:uncharacterized protein n=1 Tax=Apiospora kogelbergensis TaxID=1337665 RepID=UPI00312FA017
MVRGRASAASNQYKQSLHLTCSGSSGAQVEQTDKRHVGTEVCAAEFKASDAALNSLGSESGQRQQQTSQNIGSIDSMEKGRTSGAAHKSSKGKSSSSKGEQQQRALSPEQYLVIKRQEAVEKVMAAFNRRLADELAIITHAHEAAGGGEGASGSGSGGSHSGGDLNSGGGNAGRPSARGKRQFDDGDRNDSSSGGNGGDGQDKGGNKRAKTEENPGKSFVCPFFRHDPKRFCHHRICAGPGWKTIHRLKLPKNACPRCGDPFADAKALNAHLRSDDPCRKKDIAAAQGIDEQQEKKLKERKRVGSSVTDEQRWRDIYMILFPGANKNSLPSPYYDVTDAEEYAKTTQRLMKYKKRIEKELPALIRKGVEQRFAHVGEELLANFDDMVRDGIHVIFNCPTPKSLSAPGSPRSRQSSPAAPGTPPTKSSAEGDFGLFDTVGEPLDLSAYFNDPDAPFMSIGGLDMGFNFDNPTDCPGLDAESDSGYASTTTIRDPYFDSSRR